MIEGRMTGKLGRLQWVRKEIERKRKKRHTRHGHNTPPKPLSAFSCSNSLAETLSWACRFLPSFDIPVPIAGPGSAPAPKADQASPSTIAITPTHNRHDRDLRFDREMKAALLEWEQVRMLCVAAGPFGEDEDGLPLGTHLGGGRVEGGKCGRPIGAVDEDGV